MADPKTTGDLITAADWNAKGGYSAWTPDQQFWTVGNGTVSGRYTQIGFHVIANGRIVLGSTSTVSAGFSTSFPVAPSSFYAAGQAIVGWVSYTEAGASQYTGHMRLSSTTRARFHVTNVAGTYPVDTVASNTVPFTFGTADQIWFTMIYEAA